MAGKACTSCIGLTVKKALLFVMIVGAGAFINLVLSWSIAGGARRPYAEQVVVDIPRWAECRSAEANHATIWEGSLWRRAIVSHEADHPLVRLEVTTTEVGWPFPSMRAALQYRDDLRTLDSLNVDGMFAPWPHPVEPTLLYGVRLHPSLSPRGWFAVTDGLLPTRPLLWGFLANTLLYSGILSLPLVVFSLRRRRWSRQGRCSACGYDVGTLATCPECGLRRGCDAAGG